MASCVGKKVLEGVTGEGSVFVWLFYGTDKQMDDLHSDICWPACLFAMGVREKQTYILRY